MSVTADQPAPYAPGSTILDILDRHRTRGLPSPINADVLGRAGIAPTVIPRVLQSLQTLDLIDAEGVASATFEGLRRAPEAEYRQRLQEWLKGTYGDVFMFVDPSTDDETRIRDAFRNYQPVGQQSRMVALFQALCSLAGLLPQKLNVSVTTAIAAKPQPRSGATLSPRARRNVASLAVSPKRAPATPQPATGLPLAVSGLLASLPQDGQGWTQQRRNAFLKTFESVVDFCFPIISEESADEAA